MRYFLMSKKIFETENIGMYGIVLTAALSKYANSNGECFPGRKTISKCCNFSVSTYNKYILKLMSGGVIRKSERWRDNHSQTSNLFKINRKRKDSFPVRSDIFSKGLSPKAICVYICLSKYSADDKCCRVSQSVISSDCNMSLVSVIKAVKELKEADLIETVRQTNISNNGNYVLLYRLTDGKKYKNVTRRKIDVSNIVFNCISYCSIHTISNAIERKLAFISKRKSPHVKSTHPLYKKYTPLELCLF